MNLTIVVIIKITITTIIKIAIKITIKIITTIKITSEILNRLNCFQTFVKLLML